jgi:hypothetical protein
VEAIERRLTGRAQRGRGLVIAPQQIGIRIGGKRWVGGGRQPGKFNVCLMGILIDINSTTVRSGVARGWVDEDDRQEEGHVRAA